LPAAMPNSYFRFKQFIVQQDRSVQKVCTDACILGAWFAGKIPAGSRVLDIGSGTGLLMLMIAQKSSSEIQGIEIDPASYQQQLENIDACRWKERLRSFSGDARKYLFPAKFDFIISNPPFFETDLLSKSEQKNIAKHSKALTLEDLIKISENNLETHGSIGVLLPFHRTSYFEELAGKHSFCVLEKLLIRQTPRHPYFRTILHLSRNKGKDTSLFELTIQNEQNEYSEGFTALMKDFYFYF
jgi:tRNA1Val (adenine37-N6)-methyltransferase